VRPGEAPANTWRAPWIQVPAEAEAHKPSTDSIVVR
jgi:hypothetical protein